jgi:hypothetical protein
MFLSPADVYISALAGLVPKGVEGIDLVLRNSCGQHYTFTLHGPEVQFLGEGDLHDPKYDAQKVVVDLADTYPNQDVLKSTPGHCYVFLDIYPSDTFYEAYDSNVAMIFAIVAACVFAFKNALFGMYDLYVQKRNHKVTSAAVRSNAIVSSMFPEAVMERLVAEKENKGRQKVKGFEHCQDEKDENGMFISKPIADLYPEATVLCTFNLSFPFFRTSKKYQLTFSYFPQPQSLILWGSLRGVA